MRQFPSHHNSPPRFVDAKNMCGTGVGVYVRLCYRQRAVCSSLAFHQQAGKWALILALETFAELILPLCHLHHPRAISVSLRCQARAVTSAGAHPECNAGGWRGRGHWCGDDADAIRLPHCWVHLWHRVHGGVCLPHGECCSRGLQLSPAKETRNGFTSL